jgi:serine-type D-Ala-D-Ala carboxypeptidase (penicillin-binding protein 5/6)
MTRSRRRQLLRTSFAATLLAFALAVALAAAASARQGDTPADSPATTDAESAAEMAGIPEVPQVRSKSWAVYDAVDGNLLAGENIEQPVAIASLTKLMTALVVTERTQGTEKVLISSEAANTSDGSAIGMRAGQKYTVDTLLQAMLIYSANDAAVALAEHVGGSEARFIEYMNEEAEERELTRSTFTSVNGLDPVGKEKLTTSTPADLYLLASVVMKEPRIRQAVRLKQLTVRRPGADPVTLQNRNELLGAYAGVDGMKTGHTDKAGSCLVTHFADQDGRELYVVTLGAPDEAQRFLDTRALLDWAVPLRQKLTLAKAGDAIGHAPVADSEDSVELFVSDDISVTARVGQTISDEVVIESPVQPPLQAGDEVGTMHVLLDGERAGSSPIYVDRKLSEPDDLERYREALKDWRGALREGWEEVEDASTELRGAASA